jgi:hypothetical protein
VLFFFNTFDFETYITSLVLQKTIDFRLNGENVFVFLKRPRMFAFNKYKNIFHFSAAPKNDPFQLFDSFLFTKI